MLQKKPWLVLRFILEFGSNIMAFKGAQLHRQIKSIEVKKWKADPKKILLHN